MGPSLSYSKRGFPAGYNVCCLGALSRFRLSLKRALSAQGFLSSPLQSVLELFIRLGCLCEFGEKLLM